RVAERTRVLLLERLPLLGRHLGPELAERNREIDHRVRELENLDVANPELRLGHVTPPQPVWSHSGRTHPSLSTPGAPQRRPETKLRILPATRRRIATGTRSSAERRSWPPRSGVPAEPVRGAPRPPLARPPQGSRRPGAAAWPLPHRRTRRTPCCSEPGGAERRPAVVARLR